MSEGAHREPVVVIEGFVNVTPVPFGDDWVMIEEHENGVSLVLLGAGRIFGSLADARALRDALERIVSAACKESSQRDVGS